MISEIQKINFINNMAKTSPEEFIKNCEEKYENAIEDIAKSVCRDKGRKIIMLAGPSSSGKTTTAKKLSEALSRNGVKTYVLSLDDFYLDRDKIPFLPDGTQDFETVNSLDIECFSNTVNSLLNGETVKTPTFDFLTGKRSDTCFDEITLGKRDTVIIEGLHALNPEITEKINGKLLKIYISVSSRIYDEKGSILLNKRNLRFVRRMIRDFKFRGSSVEHTYKLWKNVMAGEDKYLFPHRGNADIRVNTTFLYEPCVLKHQALQLLYNCNITDENGGDIKKLCEVLERFADIDEKLVSSDSLLREFLG